MCFCALCLVEVCYFHFQLFPGANVFVECFVFILSCRCNLYSIQCQFVFELCPVSKRYNSIIIIYIYKYKIYMYMNMRTMFTITLFEGKIAWGGCSSNDYNMKMVKYRTCWWLVDTSTHENTSWKQLAFSAYC
jgi:hypothetical protein